MHHIPEASLITLAGAAAATMLLLAPLLAPLLGLLPNAALAAVVIVYSVGLSSQTAHPRVSVIGRERLLFNARAAIERYQTHQSTADDTARPAAS